MGNAQKWWALDSRHQLRLGLLENLKNLYAARGVSEDFQRLDQAMKDERSRAIPWIVETGTSYIELMITTLESYLKHFESRPEDKAEDKEKIISDAVYEMGLLDWTSEELGKMLFDIMLEPEQHTCEYGRIPPSYQSKGPIDCCEQIFQKLITATTTPYFAGAVEPEQIKELEKAMQECKERPDQGPWMILTPPSQSHTGQSSINMGGETINHT